MIKQVSGDQTCIHTRSWASVRKVGLRRRGGGTGDRRPHQEGLQASQQDPMRSSVQGGGDCQVMGTRGEAPPPTKSSHDTSACPRLSTVMSALHSVLLFPFPTHVST